MDKFYYENRKGQTIPRAIFVDSDIRSKNKVINTNKKFDNSLLVGDGGSCQNLFIRGRNSWDSQCNMNIEDTIRK